MRPGSERTTTIRSMTDCLAVMMEEEEEEEEEEGDV